MTPEDKVLKLCRSLDFRRRKLRMTYARLAKRSNVSTQTVIRTLSGRSPHTSFESVLSIANALGLDLSFQAEATPDEFRERQARRKAERLVRMVQGTSGLESQAVDDAAVQDMTHQTTLDLLTGSSRRLWGE